MNGLIYFIRFLQSRTPVDDFGKLEAGYMLRLTNVI